MKLKARYIKHTLRFYRPARTSRGYYTTKDSWYILLNHEHDPNTIGIGECSILPGLSFDDRPEIEQKIAEVCEQINHHEFEINTLCAQWPAIRFGVETAVLDLENGGKRVLFPSQFTRGKEGIPTNGLIWMGDESHMRQQIGEKLERGFSCIKLKIGALNWNTEYKILKYLRKQFNAEDLTIRVDANGAFSPQRAYSVLEQLAELEVHSIEQPIKAGQIEAMALLCDGSPVPIALDEELLGVHAPEKKIELLEAIKPQYLILKPGMIGGFKAAEEWIALAKEYQIGWWATSALESNIGLNAISQWTFTKDVQMPQGLGTGSLYVNNLDSPLWLRGETLFHAPNQGWNLSTLGIK